MIIARDLPIITPKATVAINYNSSNRHNGFALSANVGVFKKKTFCSLMIRSSYKVNKNFLNEQNPVLENTPFVSFENTEGNVFKYGVYTYNILPAIKTFGIANIIQLIKPDLFKAGIKPGLEKLRKSIDSTVKYEFGKRKEIIKYQLNRSGFAASLLVAFVLIFKFDTLQNFAWSIRSYLWNNGLLCWLATMLMVSAAISLVSYKIPVLKRMLSWLEPKVQNQKSINAEVDERFTVECNNLQSYFLSEAYGDGIFLYDLEKLTGEKNLLSRSFNTTAEIKQFLIEKTVLTDDQATIVANMFLHIYTNEFLTQAKVES
ncbi:hypothetical protein [Undibacterium sp. SXout20W]|uniref:hypothetical protein n=1 Tax=Undibacterium sp. SXout20W TaxID=3413051 RepID=UPI003BF3A6EA